jgi:diadenosine tetraphosphate (Ap4A) HIT family hydrolase
MTRKIYDENNIFAKILRGEIPNNTAFEDDHVLAFHDIQPQAPVHILVIPKGAYTDIHDFSAHASEQEIIAFTRAIAKLTEEFDIHEAGFRAIANCAENGGQEVPHYHMHLIGGKQLGAMLND